MPTHTFTAARRRAAGSCTSFERVHIVERISTKVLDQGVDVHEFWVDYSPIETIKNVAMRTINAAALGDSIAMSKIEDKVVILGNVSGTGDTFVVRGREYAGVLLHACAAYTLITGPLFAVTAGGRIFIDILCILIVLASITCIRFYYQRERKTVATQRVQFVLTLLLLLVPLAAGVAFVSSTRLLWNDFLLTGTSLLLHPSLEHRLSGVWTSGVRGFKRLYRMVMFGRASVPIIAAIVCLWPVSASALRSSSGFIQEIHGTVYLREPGQIERTMLDAENDLGRRLYAGQVLECAPNSSAQLRIGGVVKLLTASGPYTVPAIKLPPRDAHQRLLDAYARVGGRV